MYDLEKKKIFTSRDVIFYEDVFPFEQGISNSHYLGQESMNQRQGSGPCAEYLDDPTHDIFHIGSTSALAGSPVSTPPDLTPIQQDNGPAQPKAQTPTIEVLHEEAPHSRHGSTPCETAGDEVNVLPTAEPNAQPQGELRGQKPPIRYVLKGIEDLLRGYTITPVMLLHPPLIT